MNCYVATFHTHLSAILTCRTLTDRGLDARMAPVPRQLSSSCGTCVYYCAEDPHLSHMDEDTEAVYEQQAQTYRQIWAEACPGG